VLLAQRGDSLDPGFQVLRAVDAAEPVAQVPVGRVDDPRGRPPESGFTGVLIEAGQM
jgi:hypothetical protein